MPSSSQPGRQARPEAWRVRAGGLAAGVVIALAAAAAVLVPVVTRDDRANGLAQAAPAIGRAVSLGDSSAAALRGPDQPLGALSLRSGRSIVVLKDAASSPRAVADEYRQRDGAKVDMLFGSALQGFAGILGPGGRARARTDPRVAAVLPDTLVEASKQTLPDGVDRVDADRSPARSGDGRGTVDADVAVIDTGVDSHHPDLDVAGGVDCTGEGGFTDRSGHGTHVAGTIAAKDDGRGVVGVAPGARLWAIRALDRKGTGSTSSLICAVDWVTANADVVEVANMSLGGLARVDPGRACGRDDPLHDAICRAVKAGVTFVAAAGNADADAGRYVPAGYGEVVTVSALADYDGDAGGGTLPRCAGGGSDDTRARFSNFGPAVDLIAPGTCILSTLPGGKYGRMSGTSTASPHVAGAAALVAARQPNATPAQVKRALRRAGSTAWDDRGDPDGEREPLLDTGRLPGGSGPAAPTTSTTTTTTRPPARGGAAKQGSTSTSALPANPITQRIADDLLGRLNAERRARGLAALRWDPALASMARDWSAHMAQTDEFEHRPDLRKALVGNRIRVGENIAYTNGPDQARELHILWMRSDGHRENMLQPGFDAVGIGVVCDGDRVYATQNFGGSTGAPAASDAIPPAEPLVATAPSGLAC
ncbi:MAG TPA: S8 family serine peptidase [Actinomycetes bacterium]|nr:S8 family serine peptidase [Actinomycetes bacterium]